MDTIRDMDADTQTGNHMKTITQMGVWLCQWTYAQTPTWPDTNTITDMDADTKTGNHRARESDTVDTHATP